MLVYTLVALSLLLTALARNIPSACTKDITFATSSLVAAEMQVASAVQDCKTDDKATCAADISAAVASLAEASDRTSAAVEDCGGKDTSCGRDISQAAQALALASEAGSKAFNDCRHNASDSCQADMMLIGGAVTKATTEIMVSIIDCGKHNMARSLAEVTPTPSCTADIVSTSSMLVSAGIQIASAVRDCKTDDKATCAADISAAVASLAEASDRTSAAVEDCGGQDTTCGRDISQAAQALALASEAGSKAVNDCKHNASDSCQADMMQIGAAVTKATTEIMVSIIDCGKHNMARSLAEATPSPSCTADIVSTSSSLVGAGIQIASAVQDCKTDDKATCAADISAAVASLAEASDRTSAAVEDCGGKDTTCGRDISQAAQALALASEAGSRAVNDCKHNASDSCQADMKQIGEAVTKATTEIMVSIIDCGKHNMARSLAEVTPTPSCTADIVSTSSSLVGAGMQIASAVQDCKTDDKATCAADISAAVASLAEASDRTSAAVEDCGGQDTTCGRDISQAAQALALASEAGSKAVNDCKHNASDSCHGDMKQIGAAVTKATAEIMVAIIDCGKHRTATAVNVRAPVLI